MEFDELLIAPLCLVLLLLLSPSHGRAENIVRREINLEWESLSDASAYEIKVTRILDDKNKKEPFFIKLSNSKWRAKIAPGLYEMQLRSFDQRGVPGEWSPPSEFWVKVPSPNLVSPKPRSVLKSDHLHEQSVTLKWEPVQGAAKYRIHIKALKGSFSKEIETDQSQQEITLPVTQTYQWKVTSIMPEGVDGDPPKRSHVFRLLGARLEAPLVKAPLTSVVEQLSWKKPEKTEYFKYQLFHQGANEKWQLIEESKTHREPKIDFDLSRPSGTYRITVKAYAKGHPPSPVASHDFNVTGNLGSASAIEVAKLTESINRSTQYYAIASYFFTQMNYTSENNESNTEPTLDVIGGTGRVGIGYDAKSKPWGGFAIIDLSGFNIASQNFTFASGELHVNRHIYFDRKTRSHIGMGLYYKELPGLAGNLNEGFTGVGKVRAVGPHLGFKYWRPINYKFGIQFNARMYYALYGSGTNGQDIEPSPSMQVGLLGSYRLSSSMIGHAGYAYRMDQAYYKATPFDGSNSSLASDGDINSIKIQGHYLNLVLEVSF